MKELQYGLNYIRILCMAWILLFHARIHCGFFLGVEPIDNLILIGAVGVQGFFMTSGFVLRYNYKNMQLTPSSMK